MNMSPLQFGAQVYANDLYPLDSKVQAKLRSHATSLQAKYVKYDDDDLRIDLTGGKLLWVDQFGRSTGTYSPQAVATIQVRTANQKRVLDTIVRQKINSVGLDEPIWKFVARVKRETRKLIKATGIQPGAQQS